MPTTKEMFMQIQEELLYTQQQTIEGELSNLDALIKMREAKNEAEKILEAVKIFENDRINEITQEADGFDGRYCGFEIKYINGRKTYSFKGIKEIEDIETKIKEKKDQYQTAFESYQKGLIQTTEVDGFLNWIDDAGELHLFPELNIGKSFLQIKEINKK